MVAKTTIYVLMTHANLITRGKHVQKKTPTIRRHSFGVFLSECEKPYYVLLERPNFQRNILEIDRRAPLPTCATSSAEVWTSMDTIRQIMTDPVICWSGEQYRRTKIPVVTAFYWAVQGRLQKKIRSFRRFSKSKFCLIWSTHKPLCTLNTIESHQYYIVILLWFVPEYLLTTAAWLGISVGFLQESLRGLLVSLVRIAAPSKYRLATVTRFELSTP